MRSPRKTPQTKSDSLSLWQKLSLNYKSYHFKKIMKNRVNENKNGETEINTQECIMNNDFARTHQQFLNSVERPYFGVPSKLGNLLN